VEKLLEIKTGTYNEKRYGIPWIATINFEHTSRGSYGFGTWVGTPGYAGLLQIKVKPGDIIARGQKDNRQPRNSTPSFYLINADGEIDEETGAMSLGRAYEMWREYKRSKNTVDKDELLLEREKLLKRLGEIDNLLKTNC
jgi:hypothetical protein